MVEELIAFISKRLSEATSNSEGPKGFTVGVEHEFFLNDAQGLPCTHGQSQNFLLELSKKKGWHVQSRDTSPWGEMVSRVSRNNKNGRFTAVKYDHHPHLMEVAFEYHENLCDLYLHLDETLKLLSHVAKSVGLVLFHNPVATVPASDKRVVSDLPDFIDLRHYRSKLIAQRGQSPSLQLTNYAATIAATQTHVGGTSWWQRGSFVNELYCFEPELIRLTHAAGRSGVLSMELFKARWAAYGAVFAGFPLVGFPDVAHWSLEKWARALLHSPLAGGANDAFAAEVAEGTSILKDLGFERFMAAVRDLQIIRPKLYGTLEFRADPAQPTARAIIGVAALRLAVCIGVSVGERAGYTFLGARKLWWKGGNDLSRPDLLNRAADWLRLRKLGEETFLDIFYEQEKHRAS